METKQLFKQLNELAPDEIIGKEYFDTYGRQMSYSQLFYLNTQRHKLPLQNVHSEPARQKQKEIEELLAPHFEKGLTAETFIHPDRNIEIEQLRRYVDLPRHKHDFIEMVCVLSGKCTHVMGDYTSVHQTGHFTIVPPDVEHELYASPDCVCLTAKIRMKTFTETFSDILWSNSTLSSYFSQTLSLPHYRCALTLSCSEDLFFRDTLLRIYMQQEDGRIYNEVIIKSLWTMLFAYLMQNYQDTLEFLVSDAIQNIKLIEILNYIFENYQTITLTETARHFHLSMPHLSTKIHELTGKPFSELLRSYKLQRAAELLIQTDKKLDWICGEVGYKDVSPFIRAFKDTYNTTPGNYRKTRRNMLTD